jgi:hypothetical protein
VVTAEVELFNDFIFRSTHLGIVRPGLIMGFDDALRPPTYMDYMYNPHFYPSDVVHKEQNVPKHIYTLYSLNGEIC